MHNPRLCAKSLRRTNSIARFLRAPATNRAFRRSSIAHGVLSHQRGWPAVGGHSGLVGRHGGGAVKFQQRLDDRQLGIFTTTATIDMSDPSIPAGTPMALFQTERYDKPAGTNLIWDFPVTPGQYLVRLYFSENYSGCFCGRRRVFGVSIEGQTVLDHYDAFADVGSLKGVVKSFIVSSDSDLNITFLREVQNPSVKGIEILRAPSALQASATSLNFGNVIRWPNRNTTTDAHQRRSVG